MSIILVEGFDTYTALADAALGGWNGSPTGNVSVVTGRFAGKATRIGNFNSVPYSRGLAATAINNLSAGFAFRTDNLASRSATGNLLFGLYNGSTLVCGVYLTSAGQLRFGRTDSSGNNIVSSASALISINTWYYIEFELVRASGSGGSVTVYLDGTSVATLGSTNTGASAIDGIGLVGAVGNTDFDDLYVTNAAARLGTGPLWIETIYPTGDTAEKDFSRSAGSDNYAMVDEAQSDGDSTYTSSSTPGAYDLFDFGNLSSIPSVIYAVVPTFAARKDDATVRTMRTKHKSGATTTDGTSRGIAASYQFFTQIYETNPATLGAYTNSDVSNLQVGYELVS
jgi:hypothetical protein